MSKEEGRRKKFEDTTKNFPGGIWVEKATEISAGIAVL
jgi:hypothetical protein